MFLHARIDPADELDLVGSEMLIELDLHLPYDYSTSIIWIEKLDEVQYVAFTDQILKKFR